MRRAQPWKARPAHAGPQRGRTQIKTAHTTRRPLRRTAIFLATHCRARAHRVNRLPCSGRDVRNIHRSRGKVCLLFVYVTASYQGGCPGSLEGTDPALAIALEELEYYRRERDRASRAYQVAETLLLLAAAGATLAAGLGAAKWLTASLAASALMLTSILKVFDWHENWLDFANASLELRTVINQHRLIIPDDRRCNETSQRRLIGQIDEIAARQGSQWTSRRRQVVRDLDQ